MKIKLNINKHYGRELYYPGCELSTMLCEILKQKSLTIRDIEILKSYGCIVEMQYQMKLK